MVNSSAYTSDISKAGIKTAMQLFADIDNYPILYHCTIGTDRTGFISFALESLAGVEEDTLYRDYMLSNFGNTGNKRATSIISGYIGDMKGRSGGTNDIGKGVENFLLEIGVTQEEINSIKSILTSDGENSFDGHTPKDSWEKVNEVKHSLFCEECGDPIVTDVHNFGTPFVKPGTDDKHFIKCETCGYERETSHSYNDGICECLYRTFRGHHKYNGPARRSHRDLVYL